MVHEWVDQQLHTTLAEMQNSAAASDPQAMPR
jgi:hypothetical protein